MKYLQNFIKTQILTQGQTAQITTQIIVAMLTQTILMITQQNSAKRNILTKIYQKLQIIAVFNKTIRQ